MPPTPPVDDPTCIKIEFDTSDDAAVLATSRFFCSYSGSAPSVADLNTLATAVSAAWGTHIAGAVNTEYSLTGVKITDLSSDTGAVGVWAGSIAGATGSSGNLPASACVLINHTIARRYRGGRPRTYLCAGCASDLAGSNTWAEDFRTSTLEGWEGFVAEVQATTGVGITGLAISNISFYESFTAVLNPITGRTKDVSKLRVDGPLVDPITLSSIAVKVASQRRRLNL
jgi:hypothetical protein